MYSDAYLRERLHERLGLTRRDAQGLIDSLKQFITQSVASGETFWFKGLGKLSAKDPIPRRAEFLRGELGRVAHFRYAQMTAALWSGLGEVDIPRIELDQRTIDRFKRSKLYQHQIERGVQLDV